MDPLRTSQEEKFWRMYFKQQKLLESVQLENKQLLAQIGAHEQEKRQLTDQVKVLEGNYHNLYQIYIDKDEALNQLLNNQTIKENQTVRNLQQTVSVQNQRIAQLLNNNTQQQSQAAILQQQQINQLQQQVDALISRNNELESRNKQLAGDLEMSTRRCAYQNQYQQQIDEIGRSSQRIIQEASVDGLIDLLTQIVAEKEKRNQAGEDCSRFDEMISQFCRAGRQGPQEHASDYHLRPFGAQQFVSDIQTQTNDIITRFNSFESIYNLKVLRLSQAIDQLMGCFMRQVNRQIAVLRPQKRPAPKEPSRDDLEATLDSQIQSMEERQQRPSASDHVDPVKQLENETRNNIKSQKDDLREQYKSAHLQQSIDALNAQYDQVKIINNLFNKPQKQQAEKPTKYSTSAMIEYIKQQSASQIEKQNNRSPPFMTSRLQDSKTVQHFPELAQHSAKTATTGTVPESSDLVNDLQLSRKRQQIMATSQESAPHRKPKIGINYQEYDLSRQKEDSNSSIVNRQIEKNKQYIQRQQERRQLLLQKAKENRNKRSMSQKKQPQQTVNMADVQKEQAAPHFTETVSVNPRKELLEQEQLDAASQDLQIQLEEQILREQFRGEDSQNNGFPQLEAADLIRQDTAQPAEIAKDAGQKLPESTENAEDDTQSKTIFTDAPPDLPDPPPLPPEESEASTTSQRSRTSRKRRSRRQTREDSATIGDEPPQELPHLDEMTTEVSEPPAEQPVKRKKKRRGTAANSPMPNFGLEPSVVTADADGCSHDCSEQPSQEAPRPDVPHQYAHRDAPKPTVSDSGSFAPPVEQKILNLRRKMILGQPVPGTAPDVEPSEEPIPQTAAKRVQFSQKHSQRGVSLKSGLIDEFGNSLLSSSGHNPRLQDEFGNTIYSQSDYQQKIVDQFGNTIMSLGDSQDGPEATQNPPVPFHRQLSQLLSESDDRQAAPLPQVQPFGVASAMETKFF